MLPVRTWIAPTAPATTVASARLDVYIYIYNKIIIIIIYTSLSIYIYICKVIQDLVKSFDGFAGSALHIGDLGDFISNAEGKGEGNTEYEEEGKDSDEEDRSGEKGESASVNPDGEGEGKGPPKKKAKVWFDRDAKLLSCQEKFTNMVDSVEKDLQAAKDLGDPFSNERINAPAVAGWKVKASVIQTTLAHVLAGGEDADEGLEKYPDSFGSDGQPACSPMKDEGSEAPGRGVGHWPPCAKYMQLMRTAAWKLLFHELHGCDDQGGFKAFGSDFPKPKGALVDLLGAARKGIKELQRLVKQQA